MIEASCVTRTRLCWVERGWKGMGVFRALGMGSLAGGRRGGEDGVKWETGAFWSW